MKNMTDLILMWHRRDLRITDHLGLVAAENITKKIVGVFCLDDKILERDDLAPARLHYLIGCLQDLQTSYQQLGSQLLIIQGNPIKLIPQIADQLQAQAVYWHNDVEPYAQERDRLVKNSLEKSGITVKTFWDQLLHAPSEIFSGTGNPYTIYTPFWHNWSSQIKPSPVNSLPKAESLLGLNSSKLQLLQNIIIDLPTADQIGFPWSQPLIIQPGEAAAQANLKLFTKKFINQYETNRDIPSIDGTSKLSAALKFGVLSIRSIWAESNKLLKSASNEPARKSIITWQKELAWREFYQHALYNFPSLASGPYRPLWRDFPWSNNPDLFQAWCEGKTGYPIVDAAMRQLNTTGWMHNRCRMIVASFLTKDLIINWQWGEKYFMQKLIDGDLAANNGGWQWSASSGMDPKPLRIFNPASQAAKFDPTGSYIRQWVQELKNIETANLLTGKISPLERQIAGYPQPIVDHNQQQKHFKLLYQEQKLNYNISSD